MNFKSFFNKKRIVAYSSFMILAGMWLFLAFFISGSLSNGFVLMSENEFNFMIEIKNIGLGVLWILFGLFVLAEKKDWLENKNNNQELV